jgi:hypothetical protein
VTVSVRSGVMKRVGGGWPYHQNGIGQEFPECNFVLVSIKLGGRKELPSLVTSTPLLSLHLAAHPSIHAPSFLFSLIAREPVLKENKSEPGLDSRWDPFSF